MRRTASSYASVPSKLTEAHSAFVFRFDSFVPGAGHFTAGSRALPYLRNCWALRILLPNNAGVKACPQLRLSATVRKEPEVTTGELGCSSRGKGIRNQSKVAIMEDVLSTGG